MKLSKDEFRALQKEWYKKIKDQGFEDIEKLDGEELVLIKSCRHVFKHTDQLTRNIKTEYFRAMAMAAQDEATVYRNETDRHILIRYVEGAKIKTICAELKEMGSPRHRHSVRFIIRRYEMEWGFRHYNNRQLNILRIGA